MRKKALTVLVGIEGEAMGAITIAPEGAMAVAKALFGESAERDDPRQERSILMMLSDAAADGFAKGKGIKGAQRGLSDLPSGGLASWVMEEADEKGMRGAESALAEIAGSAWVRGKLFLDWDPKGAEAFGNLAWAPAKTISLRR